MHDQIITEKPRNKRLALAALVLGLLTTAVSMQGTGVKMTEVCYKGLKNCTPELRGVLPDDALSDLKNQPSNPEINPNAVLAHAKVLKTYQDNPFRIPLAASGILFSTAGYIYSRRAKKDSIYTAPQLRSGYEIAEFEAASNRDSLIALAKGRARIITATKMGNLNPLEIQALQACITPDEYFEYGWALDSGENAWKMELLRQSGYTGGINLHQLSQAPIEYFMPQTQEAQIFNQPELPASPEQIEDLRAKAVAIRDGLVGDADKSKLGGCVILAAPGAGKTTFLGTAWGKLKATYGKNFKSMAVVVKRTDVAAFNAVADKALCVKDNPRLVAVQILKFIHQSMTHEGVKRLFIDDFITAWKNFDTALKGIYINPHTYETYNDKKEDLDAQPLLQTLETDLNELWLVGREYNAALWVSSHSGNVDALPFVGSRESRSVGDLIYLAKTDKREFIENTLNNPNLIADNAKRQKLKTTLDSLMGLTNEPIVLANYDNWSLGIVPQSLRAEYENYRILWESDKPKASTNTPTEDVLDVVVVEDKPSELRLALLGLNKNEVYKISTVRRDNRVIYKASSGNQEVRDTIAELVKDRLADYEADDCFVII